MIATMLFAVTVLAMAFTVWQQGRAEKLAAIRPDQEAEPAVGPAALAGGAARG